MPTDLQGSVSVVELEACPISPLVTAHLTSTRPARIHSSK